RHAAAYSPDGLPLVPGLVELVRNDVMVRTDRGWVPGIRWTPRGVTPPYPGWVSDESAFAWAAAEILRETTGRSYRMSAETAARRPLRNGTESAADVAAGRRLGMIVGRDAWSQARRYMGGSS